MIIDIVTPAVKSESFTGGIWCVLQYARGLAERGHDVRVIPMLPSPAPAWFPKPWGFTFDDSTALARTHPALKSLMSDVSARISKEHVGRGQIVSDIRDIIGQVLVSLNRFLPHLQHRAASWSHVGASLRSADITLATHFETAIPVAMYATNAKAYFAQHFEPLFWRESRGGRISEREAFLTYKLALPVIANSTWLREKIQEYAPECHVDLCMNAINHEHFWPRVVPADRPSNELVVISYGGRNVPWKGFADMAEAVRIVRTARPDLLLRWQVYGGAIIPAANPIAAYEDLGFLSPSRLGDAYRGADVLLSASWYESFPLFPLEAMASGLPVVTTAAGTEDYAVPNTTAEVVEARDPLAIADGLLRLIDNKGHREQLREAGIAAAKNFTWEIAINRMNRILEGYVERDRDECVTH